MPIRRTGNAYLAPIGDDDVRWIASKKYNPCVKFFTGAGKGFGMKETEPTKETFFLRCGPLKRTTLEEFLGHGTSYEDFVQGGFQNIGYYKDWIKNLINNWILRKNPNCEKIKTPAIPPSFLDC